MLIELEGDTAFIPDQEIESTVEVNNADYDSSMYEELHNDVRELRECISLLKKSERKKNTTNATFKLAICAVILMDIIAYAQTDKTGKAADRRQDEFNVAMIIENGNQTTCGKQTPKLSCSDAATLAKICEQLLSDFCSMRTLHLEWTIATSFIFVALFVFCCAPLFNETCRKNLFRGFNHSPFRNIYSECTEDEYDFIDTVTNRHEIQTDRRTKKEVLNDLNKKLSSIVNFIHFSDEERRSIFRFFTRSIPLRVLTRRNDNRVYTYVTVNEEPEETPQLVLPPPGLQLTEEKVPDELELPEESYDFEEETADEDEGVEMTPMVLEFTTQYRNRY